MNGLDTARVLKAIMSAVPVIHQLRRRPEAFDIASTGVALFPKTAPIDGLATEIENLLQAS
jgi:hypothetical protein